MRSRLGTKSRFAAHLTSLVLLIVMLVYMTSPTKPAIPASVAPPSQAAPTPDIPQPAPVITPDTPVRPISSAVPPAITASEPVGIRPVTPPAIPPQPGGLRPPEPVKEPVKEPVAPEPETPEPAIEEPDPEPLPEEPPAQEQPAPAQEIPVEEPTPEPETPVEVTTPEQVNNALVEEIIDTTLENPPVVEPAVTPAESPAEEEPAAEPEPVEEPAIPAESTGGIIPPVEEIVEEMHNAATADGVTYSKEIVIPSGPVEAIDSLEPEPVPADAEPEAETQPESVPEQPESAAVIQPDESGSLVVAESDAGPGPIPAVTPLPANANLEVLGDGVYWLDSRHDIVKELEAIPETGTLILLAPLPGYRVQGLSHVRTEVIPADADDLTEDSAQQFAYLTGTAIKPVVVAAIPGARGAAFFKGIYLLVHRNMEFDEVLKEIEPDLLEAGPAQEELIHRLRRIDANSLQEMQRTE